MVTEGCVALKRQEQNLGKPKPQGILSMSISGYDIFTRLYKMLPLRDHEVRLAYLSIISLLHW